MAGQGLIWASVGQGIANAGSTVGSFLLRAQEREADRDYRNTVEQERRDYRDKSEQDKREYRAEQDALYKRTAAQQMEGRAGSGGKDPGIQAADLQPGGKYAGMAAGQLDMTENQLADLQDYRKTGNLSKYAKPIGTTLDDEYGVQTVTDVVPQALRDELKLKAKALSQLEESYALKGSFDDVMKGRNTGFKTGVGQSVLAGTTKMGTGSGAVAASEGKPIINIEGGEKYNQYLGDSATTPLGRSQIAENQAKAGEAKQKGDAAETKAERQEKDKRETTKDLERRIENNLAVLHEKLGVNKNEANETLKRLRIKAASDPAAAEQLKTLQPFIDKVDASRAKLDAWEAKATPSDAGGGASNAAKPKPAAAPTGAMPEPKSAADVAKLKPGTRFKAPDGSIRVR